MKASLQDFITKIFTQIKNNYGNVDNTSDEDKPISIAQQSEFDKLNSNLKEEIKKIDNDNNKLQDSVNDINSKIDEEEKIKKDEVEVYQSWKKLKETLTEALSH